MTHRIAFLLSVLLLASATGCAPPITELHQSEPPVRDPWLAEGVVPLVWSHDNIELVGTWLSEPADSPLWDRHSLTTLQVTAWNLVGESVTELIPIINGVSVGQQERYAAVIGEAFNVSLPNGAQLVWRRLHRALADTDNGTNVRVDDHRIKRAPVVAIQRGASRAEQPRQTVLFPEQIVQTCEIPLFSRDLDGHYVGRCLRMTEAQNGNLTLNDTLTEEVVVRLPNEHEYMFATPDVLRGPGELTYLTRETSIAFVHMYRAHMQLASNPLVTRTTIVTGEGNVYSQDYNQYENGRDFMTSWNHVLFEVGTLSSLRVMNDPVRGPRLSPTFVKPGARVLRNLLMVTNGPAFDYEHKGILEVSLRDVTEAMFDENGGIAVRRDNVTENEISTSVDSVWVVCPPNQPRGGRPVRLEICHPRDILGQNDLPNNEN